MSQRAFITRAAHLSRASALSLACLGALGSLGPTARAQTVEIEIEDEGPDTDAGASPPDATEPASSETGAMPADSTPLQASTADSAQLAELAALRARVETLEARTRASETASSAAEAETAETEDAQDDTMSAADALLAAARRWGISLSGYVQAQYEWSDLSEDQLLQGGVVANRDRFSIRRGRLRLAGAWEHFEIELEVDGSTTRGPFFGLRRTTVSALYRNPDETLPPYVQLSAGLTEIPFGHEVRQGQRDWLFMERSTGSLAFFLGPLDMGIRVEGGLGPFRYDLAVMGGTPLDDRAGQAFGVDPTSAPDVVGRLGAERDLDSTLELGGGVSFLYGTGFHPGADATKGRLEWRDLNESGTLDTGEIVAVPGRAATPSLNFERWAVGADAHFGVRTPLGWTRLFAEAVMASNLDRALFVADPIALGVDVRELSAYLAVTQELFEWGLIGLRYDYYDPNSDLLDQRRGISVPADASIHTVSPLLGARIPDSLAPGFRARLVLQYDAIFDQLGRDARGVPADLLNDQLTVRVQGEFR